MTSSDKTISSGTVTKEISSNKKGVETEIQDNIMDNNLIAYQFYKDMMADNDKKGNVMFFDTTDPLSIPTTTYGSSEINRGLMVKNTRWITFNIPAIDADRKSVV